MNKRTYFALIAAGWMAAGCQSMRVQTEYDHQVAFAEFHTYCWVPAPAWLRNDPRLHMDLVEPLVQRDVEAQLAARGYRRGDCATADFQVTFTGGLQESFHEAPGSHTRSTAIYQYSPGSGGEWFTQTSDLRMTEKRVPSLIILVQQPGSDRVLWEGMASANLPRAVNDAQIAQRVETAVHLIMQQFPVPARKGP